jgi:predicted enzyme related to lactoylglutathione lyase
MTDPVGRFAHIVIDCLDPERVAAFWSGALGTPVQYRWQQYVMLRPTGDGHPGLAFQAVPEAKQGKNRVHLDLAVDDLDRAQAAAEALGGTLLRENRQEGVVVRIMADPEGNELCLVKTPDH